MEYWLSLPFYLGNVYSAVIMAEAVSRVQPVQLMTLHNYAVERGLVVGFYCYRPYYPTARFRPSSSCRANLHRCGLTQSPSCDCGHQQTMNHIVEMCPLTKFEGGLNLLHEADDKAVIWLESTVTAAANPQTKPTELGCEYTSKLLQSTSTLPFCYYYSAQSCYSFYHSMKGGRLS